MNKVKVKINGYWHEIPIMLEGEIEAVDWDKGESDGKYTWHVQGVFENLKLK